MSKPSATGTAADFRATVGDLGIKLPVKVDADRPGYILGSDGTTVAAVNMAGLSLNDARATKLATALANAINWYSGSEKMK